MVCCVKEKYGGETAIFTCGDDPEDYCAQKSCEGGKYNITLTQLKLLTVHCPNYRTIFSTVTNGNIFSLLIFQTLDWRQLIQIISGHIISLNCMLVTIN